MTVSHWNTFLFVCCGALITYSHTSHQWPHDKLFLAVKKAQHLSISASDAHKNTLRTRAPLFLLSSVLLAVNGHNPKIKGLSFNLVKKGLKDISFQLSFFLNKTSITLTLMSTQVWHSHQWPGHKMTWTIKFIFVQPLCTCPFSVKLIADNEHILLSTS